MFEPMQEPLRRAYLQAMGVPVWVLRSDEPEEIVEPSIESLDASQPAEGQPAEVVRSGRSIRDRLKGAVPEPSRKPDQAASTNASPGMKPRAAAPVNPAERIELRFIWASGVVMVISGTDNPKKAEQMLASIAFALTGVAARAQSTLFQWPPPGLQLDASETRAAATSRLTKIRDTDALKLVLLMGDGVASTLLDEGAAELLGTPALRSVPLHALLEQPLQKRELWKQIAGYRQ